MVCGKLKCKELWKNLLSSKSEKLGKQMVQIKNRVKLRQF